MKMTDLHENGHAGETHFHMNGFARRLVLRQRQRVIRKWPIIYYMALSHKDWELPNSEFDWLKSILTAVLISHVDRHLDRLHLR